MGELAFSFNHTLLICCECQIGFTVLSSVKERWLRDDVWWYCPAGHKQHFTESSVARLQRELDKEKQRREWAEASKQEAWKQAERSNRRTQAYRGVITKTKRRIGNGVCPCCNRTFQNVMAHMNTKHPKYKRKTK